MARQKIKHIIGLIKADYISETWPIGNVYVSPVIGNMMMPGIRPG